MKIIVDRKRLTEDAILGKLSLDFNPFTCFTLENKLLAVPAGLFKVTFDYSKTFNRMMPHIWVPDRDAAARARGDDNAGLRIHWGNLPKNYKGCIGVGDKEEADAIDNTVATFNQLYKIISSVQDLYIQINDPVS